LFVIFEQFVNLPKSECQKYAQTYLFRDTHNERRKNLKNLHGFWREGVQLINRGGEINFAEKGAKSTSQNATKIKLSRGDKITSHRSLKFEQATHQNVTRNPNAKTSAKASASVRLPKGGEEKERDTLTMILPQS
jgi:hypothetical protein